LALADILRDVHAYVLKLKISEEVQMFLLEKMADIEYALSVGTSEKLQLSALIGAFQIAKETIANKGATIDSLMRAASY
jgi:replication factor C subunit 3/5